MNTDNVYERLTQIMRDVFDDDDVVATAELSAVDVDEWDSLSNLRLMMSVEKEFGIKFSAAEIGKLKNVGELNVLIISKSTK